MSGHEQLHVGETGDQSGLPDLTAGELARRIASGQVSAVEVVTETLHRIERRDPILNAFSVVLADQAMEDAIILDAQLSAGQPVGPLHGVPVAIKEELDVAGCVTTFGGRGNSTPVAQDGEVVRRLRQAGAIVIGKTRMPEFGQWPFTESRDGGVSRNPWDHTRTPGGSSGGSAAAVAGGMVPIGIGGDGGGSIRIPAAHCGLYGLKPSRGRVTSDPMPHLWWSLGTTGPLTRSVADSALVYDVIRGNTAGDRYTAPEPPTSFIAAAGREPGRLRIGWSLKPAARGVRVHPEHAQAVQRTAALLAELGHDVAEIDPHYPDATAAFVPQFFAGVRAEADAVEHPELLEPRTKEVLKLGSWVTQARLESALRAGEKVAAKANRVFDRVDVLLTPMLAQRPRRVGALSRGGTVSAALKSNPLIAWTALWNVAGNPAASIPAGVGEDGLPLAVQLVAPLGDEITLLGLSSQLERARPWPGTAASAG